MTVNKNYKERSWTDKRRVYEMHKLIVKNINFESFNANYSL